MRRLPAAALLLAALTCHGGPFETPTPTGPSCFPGGVASQCPTPQVCVPFGQVGFFCAAPCKTNLDCPGHQFCADDQGFGKVCQAP
jgi:hypothetical protein